MEDSQTDLNIKIEKLEKKVIDLENKINKENINLDDEDQPNPNSQSGKKELKEPAVSKKELEQQLIDKSKEINDDLENFQTQNVYCQCCNFTNSNHNAVKLILEFFILFLNIVTVSSLCYMLIVRS